MTPFIAPDEEVEVISENEPEKGFIAPEDESETIEPTEVDKLAQNSDLKNFEESVIQPVPRKLPTMVGPNFNKPTEGQGSTAELKVTPEVQTDVDLEQILKSQKPYKTLADFSKNGLPDVNAYNQYLANESKEQFAQRRADEKVKKEAEKKGYMEEVKKLERGEYEALDPNKLIGAFDTYGVKPSDATLSSLRKFTDQEARSLPERTKKLESLVLANESAISDLDKTKQQYPGLDEVVNQLNVISTQYENETDVAKKNELADKFNSLRKENAEGLSVRQKREEAATALFSQVTTMQNDLKSDMAQLQGLDKYYEKNNYWYDKGATFTDNLKSMAHSLNRAADLGFANVLRHADALSKIIAGATPLESSGAFGKIADKIEAAVAARGEGRHEAETVATKVSAGVGGLGPMLSELALTPEYGIGKVIVPKFVTYMGYTSALDKFNERMDKLKGIDNLFNKPEKDFPELTVSEKADVLGETLKAGAIGLGEGVILHTLMLGANRYGGSLPARAALSGGAFAGYEAVKEKIQGHQLNDKDLIASFIIGAGLQAQGEVAGKIKTGKTQAEATEEKLKAEKQQADVNVQDKFLNAWMEVTPATKEELQKIVDMPESPEKAKLLEDFRKQTLSEIPDKFKTDLIESQGLKEEATQNLEEFQKTKPKGLDIWNRLVNKYQIKKDVEGLKQFVQDAQTVEATPEELAEVRKIMEDSWTDFATAKGEAVDKGDWNAKMEGMFGENARLLNVLGKMNSRQRALLLNKLVSGEGGGEFKVSLSEKLMHIIGAKSLKDIYGFNYNKPASNPGRTFWTSSRETIRNALTNENLGPASEKAEDLRNDADNEDPNATVVEPPQPPQGPDGGAGEVIPTPEDVRQQRRIAAQMIESVVAINREAAAIAANPDTYITLIKNDDSISPEDKDMFYKMVDDAVQNKGALGAQAAQITKDLDELQMELESVSDGGLAGAAQSKVIQDKIDGKTEELRKLYADYKTSKERADEIAEEEKKLAEEQAKEAKLKEEQGKYVLTTFDGDKSLYAKEGKFYVQEEKINGKRKEITEQDAIEMAWEREGHGGMTPQMKPSDISKMKKKLGIDETPEEEIEETKPDEEVEKQKPIVEGNEVSKNTLPEGVEEIPVIDEKGKFVSGKDVSYRGEASAGKPQHGKGKAEYGKGFYTVKGFDNAASYGDKVTAYKGAIPKKPMVFESKEAFDKWFDETGLEKREDVSDYLLEKGYDGAKITDKKVDYFVKYSKPSESELSKKPKIETSESFAKIPISELTTDLENFQGRKAKYSKQTFDRIVNEAKEGTLNISAVPPIQVWRNPEGEWVILGGHSRTAGWSALASGEYPFHEKYNKGDFERINAQIVEADTLEEAKKIAQESNQGAQQTDIENAVRVRELREGWKGTKGELAQKLSDLYGKNANKLEKLSFLSPDGSAMQALSMFEGANEGEYKDTAAKYASWTGEARKRFPALTDAHETEIFNYLMQQTDAERKALSKETDFLQKIQGLVNSLVFKADEPLNLKRIARKTSGEELYDKEMEGINTNIAEKQQAIKKYEFRINEPTLTKAKAAEAGYKDLPFGKKDAIDNPDYIRPDDPSYAELKGAVKDKVTALEKDLQAWQKKKLDLMQKKGQYLGGGQNQGGLFSQVSEQMKNEFGNPLKEQELEYRGQHRIKNPITTADDLLKAAPEDFLTKPNVYYDLKNVADKESHRALKQIQGKPDAEVTIYRAVPEGVTEINEGDWVSLSPTYAKEHGMHETDESKDLPVISKKVKASEIGWDGNDINEFSYAPPKEGKQLPKELQGEATISNTGFGGNREHTSGKVNLEDLKVLDNGIETANKTLETDKEFKPSTEPITVGVDVNTGEKQLLDGYHRYVLADGKGEMEAKFIPMLDGDVISFDNAREGLSLRDEQDLSRREQTDREPDSGSGVTLSPQQLQHITQRHENIAYGETSQNEAIQKVKIGEIDLADGKVLRDSNLIKDFEEKNNVVVGDYTFNPKTFPLDVANLFAPVRSPLIEKLSIMHYMADGKVQVIELHTCGMPDAVNIGPDYGTVKQQLIRIIGDCIRMGAKGFAIAHNHPSGDPTPSFADSVFTKEVSRLVNNARMQGFDIEFGGHVVTNSNRFTYIQSFEGGKVSETEHTYEAKNFHLDNYPTLQFESDKQGKMLEYAKQINEGGYKRAVVYLDTRLGLRGFDMIPDNITTTDLGKKIEGRMPELGSVRYVVVSDQAMTKEMVNELPAGLADMIQVTDGKATSLGFDKKKLAEDGSEYSNYQRLQEPEEPYKPELPAEVKEKALANIKILGEEIYKKDGLMGQELKDALKEHLKGLGIGHISYLVDEADLPKPTREEIYEDIAGMAPNKNTGRIVVDPILGGKPKNISEIIFDVTKGIKQRLFFSKPDGRRSALGTYSPGNTAVKIKFNGDLDTTAHELGHSIDDHFGVLSEILTVPNLPVEIELDKFSPFGSKPPAGHPNPRMYGYGEGFAEFLRALIVNPDKAKAEAPNLYALYESKVDSEYKKAVEDFSNDIRTFAGASGRDMVLSNIRWEPKEKPGIINYILSKSEANNMFSITWADKVAALFLNPLRAFDKANEYAKGLKGIDEQLPEDDPITFARLLLGGSNDKTSNIIEHGMIDADLNLLKDANDKPKNLEWLLEPLDNTDKESVIRDAKDTLAYMIAERTVEIGNRFERESILTGIGGGIYSDVEVAQKALDEFNNGDPNRLTRIKEAANRYRELADDVLKYMVAKGRMAQRIEDKDGNLIGGYDKIKQDNVQYVAMQRVMETEPDREVEVYSGGGKSLASKTEVVKKIGGSTKEIQNPYVTLLDMVNKGVREADRNEALLAFRNLIVPEAQRSMYDGTPLRLADIGVRSKAADAETITIFVDGKPEYWKFQTDVYKALKGLDAEAYKLPLVMTIGAKTLRWTVTNFPVFAARNVWRDTRDRMIKSNENSWRNAFGVGDLVGNKEHWNEVARAGGLGAGYYAKDREHYYGLLDQAMHDIAKNKKFVLVDGTRMKELWDGYKSILTKSETVNRVAEYRAAFRNAKEQGMDDYNAKLYAAMQSRDLIDFALMGHWMKYVNQVIPFSNAAVQGLRSGAVKAKDNPAGFLLRLLGLTVLPGIALWLLNHRDEKTAKQYEELPDYQRDMFDNYKINDNLWVSAPRPFELSLPGAGIDRAMSYANGDTTAFDGYAGSVFKTMIPFGEGSLLGWSQQIAEGITNYDVFRKKNIVPPHEEPLTLALRNTERASRLGKAIQEVAGIDARKIDHFIMGQFSYYGKTALEVSDIGREEEPNPFSVPDLGFFKNSPAYNSKSVQKFMELTKEYGLTGSPEYREFQRLAGEYFDAKTNEEKDKKGEVLTDYAKSELAIVDKLGQQKIADIPIKKEVKETVDKGAKADKPVSEIENNVKEKQKRSDDKKDAVEESLTTEELTIKKLSSDEKIDYYSDKFKDLNNAQVEAELDKLIEKGIIPIYRYDRSKIRARIMERLQK